jgi:hypothetical protein
MNDHFEELRYSPDGCLSGFQVSLAAIDELEPALLAHATDCALCGPRLSVERALVRAAVYEPVPDAIGRAMAKGVPNARRWASWLPAMGVIGVAAAAVVVFTVTRDGNPGEGERLKGACGLLVSVERAGRVVVECAPLAAEVRPLKDGDRLRLQLAATSPRRVALQADEWGHGIDDFLDRVGAEGWLPIGMTVTSDSATSMRWPIAATDGGSVSADDDQACRSALVVLRVAP